MPQTIQTTTPVCLKTTNNRTQRHNILRLGACCGRVNVFVVFPPDCLLMSVTGPMNPERSGNGRLPHGRGPAFGVSRPKVSKTAYQPRSGLVNDVSGCSRLALMIVRRPTFPITTLQGSCTASFTVLRSISFILCQEAFSISQLNPYIWSTVQARRILPP